MELQKGHFDFIIYHIRNNNTNRKENLAKENYRQLL